MQSLSIIKILPSEKEIENNNNKNSKAKNLRLITNTRSKTFNEISFKQL